MAKTKRFLRGRRFRPLILHGHVQASHALGHVVDLRHGHGLWSLESGTLQVLGPEGRRRYASPALFMTTPATHVRPDRGTHFRYIAFADDARQPQWTMPTDIPAALVERARRLVLLWSDRWWRSDQDLIRCNAQLTLFLLDLMAYQDGASPVAQDESRTQRRPSEVEDPWLSDLKKIILQDLPHGPTAATMATAMGLSRSQLYRKLAQQTRRSVKGLIQDIRLQEAMRLLLKPEVRVASVGRMCGFARSTVFTRWFRKQTGLSPTDWRQEMIPGFSLTRVGGRKRRELGAWDSSRSYP